VVRAGHHQGLLVSDLERAVGFYVEALAGRRLTGTVRLEGPAAEMVMDGPRGTRYEMAIVGFDAGAVELFCFAGSRRPPWADGAHGRRLPHLGIQVDDVDLVLERVERAGGRRLFAQVERWGKARVVYAADPDGNVIELLDAPLEAIVAAAVRRFGGPPGA